MNAPVTALYAGLFGLLIVVLGILVTRQRMKNKVSLGGGEAPALKRAIRAHANCIEYVPIALLLMLVAEINQGAPRMLHGYGATLFAARVAHAWGLSRTDKPNPGRFIGSILTWLVIIGLATVNLLR